MARRMFWVVAIAALSACDGEPEELDAAVVIDGGVTVDAYVEPCARRSDCDDGRYCNGVESCEPGATNADARGCVPGEAPCLATQICDDDAETCETDCETAPDADGDGRRARACGGDDCDDTNPSIFPGAMEVCDDGDVDEDCDPINTHGSRDLDGDLHSAICCNVDEDGVRRCSGTDCDDAVPSTNPAASDDTCDSVDNDCDTAVDEDAGAMVYFVDADGDGYGSEAAGAMLICGEPPPNYSLLPGDCRDDLPTVFPGAPQLCDRIENRCDRPAPGEVRVAEDVDDDGFAAIDADCEGGELPKTDCHDDVANAHPGAPELCATDEIDENCDGAPLGGCPTGEVIIGPPVRQTAIGTPSANAFCTYASDAACDSDFAPTPAGDLPTTIGSVARPKFFETVLSSYAPRASLAASQIVYSFDPDFPISGHLTEWYVVDTSISPSITSCTPTGDRDGFPLAVGMYVLAEPDLPPSPLYLICDTAVVVGADADAEVAFETPREVPDLPAPPTVPPARTRLECPAGEVLLGFHGTHDGDGITEIGITCATLELEYHPVPAPAP